MNLPIQEYAAWLREQMKKYNLTTGELSTLVGVSNATVIAWRIGNRKPSRRNQDKINEVFDKIEKEQSKPPEQRQAIIIQRGVSPLWMFAAIAFLILALLAYTIPNKLPLQKSAIINTTEQTGLAAAAIQGSSIEETVYVATNATVYHLFPDCFHIRDKEKEAISLDEAQRRKLPLCKDCWRREYQ